MHRFKPIQLKKSKEIAHCTFVGIMVVPIYSIDKYDVIKKY